MIIHAKIRAAEDANAATRSEERVVVAVLGDREALTLRENAGHTSLSTYYRRQVSLV